MKRGIVAERDVLIYKDGGKPGELRPAVTYVSKSFPFATFCINEHVFRARSDYMSQEVLYCALTTDDALWQMRELATGVAQPGLNQQAMRSLTVTMPEQRSLLVACQGLIAPLLDGCNENSSQSSTLAATRDLLLPKLMSGEIRLSEAMAIAEGAT